MSGQSSEVSTTSPHLLVSQYGTYGCYIEKWKIENIFKQFKDANPRLGNRHLGNMVKNTLVEGLKLMTESFLRLHNSPTGHESREFTLKMMTYLNQELCRAQVSII